MENRKYCFLVEDSDFDSFLSFCEVNKITLEDYYEIPFGGEVFLLEGNKVKAIELSDDDSCFDWDDFLYEYYQNSFSNLSNKETIIKLKNEGYSLVGGYLVYKDLKVDVDFIIDIYDTDVTLSLLEMILVSNQPLGHPEIPKVKSKSYLDFNPLN